MQVCWPRRGPSVALAAFFVALLCLGARLADGLNKDPYKVLGVSKDVDDAALKRAYKKLALKYHPDKNPAGQSRFIEIQQAYEILSDPEKKRNYDLGGSSGGGGGYHHGGFHYQYQSRSSFHEQQQRQYQQYQQYQQSQEQAYDRALPSNTSFLTVSNFRSLVFHGGRPWLALIYSEHSSTCREFSPTWEALWRSLGGTAAGAGARDGAVVGLGRIHVRYQRSLVSWISKADSPFSGGGIKEGDVPVIVAVPSGCGDPNCFVRYKGPLRLSSLQDFVAERLLHLPRVVQLEPPGVEAFLRRASPFRVVMVAFGRGGGHGSLALRLLASRQKEMLTVVRAHVQEGSSGATSASAWRSALNLSSSPSYGTLVFLRGPGTLPRTLQMSGGKGDIQSVIDSDSGVLWHEVPPLRPNTGASLGCLWGRAAAASGQSMIETCVLAIARRGPALEEARRKMAVLGRHLAAAAAQRDPSVSSAATAYMAGKLRLAFVEANTQRQVCKALLGEPKAMRRSAFTPPPGTNSAGRAAAVQAALLAAAAKSPELVEAVCGPSLPVRLMDGARTQLASALKYVGFEHMSAAVRPKMPSAVLVILRPTADGSSWFRGGGAQHSRNGRRVFLHAVNSDYDMAAVNGQRGSSDNDLGRLIAPWINSMHADPDRQMHASTAFPPALQPDEEPGVIEYVASRVYERGTQLLHMLLTVGGFASEDGSEVSAESQLVNVAVVLAVLALIHYALWRRPAGAPRPPASLREDARRRAEAARAAARAHPERPSGTSHPPSSEGPDDPSAAARRGRSPSPSPVVNRRALSPSWAQGRRGEDDGDRREGVSDDVAGGGGHVDDDADACFLGACDGDEAGSTEAEAEVAAGARPSEGRAAGQGRRGRSGRGEQEEEEEEGGKGTGSPAEEDGAGAQGDGRVSDDGWQHVQVGAVRGGGSGED